MQSLLKTAEHLKIKGLCEVNDQCDNFDYFNYNPVPPPRQAHTQQYLSGHHSKSSSYSNQRFGESSSSSKRLLSTPQSNKGRKSPRLTNTPDIKGSDGQLISSDTAEQTGEREGRGREKGKMASLGMGMVSKKCFFFRFFYETS